MKVHAQRTWFASRQSLQKNLVRVWLRFEARLDSDAASDWEPAGGHTSLSSSAARAAVGWATVAAAAVARARAAAARVT